MTRMATAPPPTRQVDQTQTPPPNGDDEFKRLMKTRFNDKELKAIEKIDQVTSECRGVMERAADHMALGDGGFRGDGSGGEVMAEATNKLSPAWSRGIGGHHAPNKGATDEWLTPPPILKALGSFDLDPCSPVDRPWPTAARHFSINDNGLWQSWGGAEVRVWLNPPYGPLY